MGVLISIFTIIGLLFKWFFFVIGIVVTGMVINQLIQDAAARKGAKRAEAEIAQSKLDKTV